MVKKSWSYVEPCGHSPRVWQTDGQTDRITIRKTVQRIASHGKNVTHVSCWQHWPGGESTNIEYRRSCPLVEVTHGPWVTSSRSIWMINSSNGQTVINCSLSIGEYILETLRSSKVTDVDAQCPSRARIWSISYQWLTITVTQTQYI